VRKSIDRIVAAGYFDKRNVRGKKSVLAPVMSASTPKAEVVRHPGLHPGQDPGLAKSRNAYLTDASSPIPGSPCVSETPYQGKDSDSDSVVHCESPRRFTESLPKTLDTAYGLWREILPRFGVPATALNGKHQACPACGGKDRFRFTDRKGDGDYFCNGCGAGKGISLVAKVNGWSYPEAAKRIDEFLHRPYASRAA
jgi:Zinc-binding domain of primase-helicase